MQDRIAPLGGDPQGRSSPLTRKTAGRLRGLHAQTVETIGSRIVHGHYAPGSQLPPPEQIERELGISKTVLREAMRVLAAKGLVESRQKLGTVVQPRSSWSLLDPELLRWRGSQPDQSYLDDLAEVRYIVEPAGARLAALRRTDGDLDQLRTALQAMAAAGGDAAAVIEADLAFHRALLYAAHNELLSSMEMVIEAGLRARDIVVHNRTQWPDSVPVHRRIAAAIEAGDSAAAETAMIALLDQASTDVGRVKGGGHDSGTSPRADRRWRPGKGNKGKGRVGP